LAQLQVGDEVVFGARLASFQYDTDAEEWVVRLEPKSGIAMKYTRALEAVGWPIGASHEEGRGVQE
jgi:hypothetical protein